MAAKLVAEEGAVKGLVLSLEEGEQWVIGRDPDAAQLLVEDPAASRKHVLCHATPEGIVVENLSETNPALLNGDPLSEPILLNSGDRVTIGSSTFRFYPEGESEMTGGLEDGAQISGLTAEEEEEKPAPEQEAPEKEEKEEPEAEPPKPKEEEHPEPEKEETPEAKEEEEHPEPEKEETPEAKEEEHPEPEKEETPEHKEEISEAEVAAHDSLYEEEDEEKNILAEIDFDIKETGRWLLKVIGGPNTGAEFSMQSGAKYLIGTDPNSCDIVFHDTSVSRQHARISVGENGDVSIEDLNSRNKTFIDGEPVTEKHPLEMNALVTMGTTSFIVYDREGDMQTIISPLLPDIVRSLKEKEEKKEKEKEEAEAAAKAEEEEAKQPAKPEKKGPKHRKSELNTFMLIGAVSGGLILLGLGTLTLFQSSPIESHSNVKHPDEVIQKAVAQFPTVKATFNEKTGQLLLVGHVLTPTDRNELLYSLQGLPFIKKINDNGLVIDEYVWEETNQVLSRDTKWTGISLHAPKPGDFVLSGYLKTRQQYEALSNYMTANFPYLDLLHMDVVVEQDVENNVETQLQNEGIHNVTVHMSNGELTLKGGVQPAKFAEFQKLLADFRKISGVRLIRNYVKEIEEAALVNISDKYNVTGYSKIGNSISVVVNGKILTVGDTLDGMTVTEIKPNMILLKKDGVKYRIDYSQ